MGAHGLEIKRINYMQNFFIGLFILFIINNKLCNAQPIDSIADMLSGKNWEKISSAISIINQNTENFKNDQRIRKAIVLLFKLETECLRNSMKCNFENKKGESEGEVAFLVVKLDLKEAIPDLIDWVDNSIRFKKYILKQLSPFNCNSDIFDSIYIRFNKPEEFYVLRRDGYMKLVCHLIDSSKTKCEKLYNYGKKMVFSLMNDTNSEMSRLNAVKYSNRFINDSSINCYLKYLSRNNPYTENKNGKKIYPVRIEAEKVLSGD